MSYTRLIQVEEGNLIFFSILAAYSRAHFTEASPYAHVWITNLNLGLILGFNNHDERFKLHTLLLQTLKTR